MWGMSRLALGEGSDKTRWTTLSNSNRWNFTIQLQYWKILWRKRVMAPRSHPRENRVKENKYWRFAKELGLKHENPWFITIMIEISTDVFGVSGFRHLSIDRQFQRMGFARAPNRVYCHQRIRFNWFFDGAEIDKVLVDDYRRFDRGLSFESCGDLDKIDCHDSTEADHFVDEIDADEVDNGKILDFMVLLCDFDICDGDWLRRFNPDRNLPEVWGIFLTKRVGK